MTLIAAILPSRGRPQQLAALIPRLLLTAGEIDWRLVVVADEDPDTAAAARSIHDARLLVVHNPARLGYWASLRAGSLVTDAPYLVALADDLLPGVDWLVQAWHAYRNAFANGWGMVAFNDGVHAGQHASHMLIARGLLTHWYGDEIWPTMYEHLRGDAELTARAKQEQCYAAAPWAVLYHNHPCTGAPSDSTYAIANATDGTGLQTLHRRGANQWNG